MLKLTKKQLKNFPHCDEYSEGEWKDINGLVKVARQELYDTIITPLINYEYYTVWIKEIWKYCHVKTAHNALLHIICEKPDYEMFSAKIVLIDTGKKHELQTALFFKRDNESRFIDKLEQRAQPLIHKVREVEGAEGLAFKLILKSGELGALAEPAEEAA